MRVTVTVEVEVERTEGKFATREEIEEAVLEALESANPDTIDGIGADGTSSYEVTDWSVNVEAQPKPVRRPRKPMSKVVPTTEGPPSAQEVASWL